MIQKLDNPSIILPSAGSSGTLPGDAGNLLKEVDKFEAEVNCLTADLEKIDASIMSLRQSFDDLAEGINNLGSASVDIFSSGSSNKAKGIIGMLSLAIKGAGYVTQQYKQKKSREEYSAKRQEILYQKQDVANEKLPHVREAYSKYRDHISDSITAIYAREASKNVDINDSGIESAIAMMRSAMSLHLKSRYLMEVMRYCIAEMEAWQKGRHDSSSKVPSVDDIITEEISQWEHKYCHSMPWDLYLLSAMDMDSGHLPLPIALLLSSPALFRCYVGVNIGRVENCPFGLLQMDRAYRCGNVRNPLVLDNPYYRHCLDIASNKYRPPRRTASFSLPDLLILLLIPAALFGLLLLIFRWEDSAGWRIFFMIPALCWAGIAIDYLRNNAANIMPGYRDALKTNDKWKACRKEIMEMEDCREFHIFY